MMMVSSLCGDVKLMPMPMPSDAKEVKMSSSSSLSSARKSLKSALLCLDKLREEGNSVEDFLSK